MLLSFLLMLLFSVLFLLLLLLSSFLIIIIVVLHVINLRPIILNISFVFIPLLFFLFFLSLSEGCASCDQRPWNTRLCGTAHAPATVAVAVAVAVAVEGTLKIAANTKTSCSFSSSSRASCSDRRIAWRSTAAVRGSTRFVSSHCYKSDTFFRARVLIILFLKRCCWMSSSFFFLQVQ